MRHFVCGREMFVSLCYCACSSFQQGAKDGGMRLTAVAASPDQSPGQTV